MDSMACSVASLRKTPVTLILRGMVVSRPHSSGYMRRLVAAAYLWARDKGLTEIRLFTSACEPVANLRAEEMGFEAFEIVRRRPVERNYPTGKTPFDRPHP